MDFSPLNDDNEPIEMKYSVLSIDVDEKPPKRGVVRVR